MSRKKKLSIGVGGCKAALDRFEAVWKHTERIASSHSDLRASMPRLRQDIEKLQLIREKRQRGED